MSAKCEAAPNRGAESCPDYVLTFPLSLLIVVISGSRGASVKALDAWQVGAPLR